MSKTGYKLKLEGQDRVQGNNSEFVATMRRVAKDIATKRGSVSSDDLRIYADDNGIEPESPNAWGAIFRGKSFIEVGRTKSVLSSNHDREIRVWNAI